ncbi:MAG: hypothetical protein D8H97_07505 [Neisseria sp.]|nr:MAG: hypothetical protein D8H97_07505 [Neisseria sp.]
MGSLLVRATFGERAVGILVWQSGKRSSENGFQTTFGLGGKGGSFRRPRACVPHTIHMESKFCVICRSDVSKNTDTVGQATY